MTLLFFIIQCSIYYAGREFLLWRTIKVGWKNYFSNNFFLLKKKKVSDRLDLPVYSFYLWCMVVYRAGSIHSQDGWVEMLLLWNQMMPYDAEYSWLHRMLAVVKIHSADVNIFLGFYWSISQILSSQLTTASQFYLSSRDIYHMQSGCTSKNNSLAFFLTLPRSHFKLKLRVIFW